MTSKELRDKIRNEYREKRRELNAEQCIYYSEQITKNFLSNWHFKDQLIHCFLPIHRLKEVETNPLIEVLRQNNQICIPMSNFTKEIMEHKLLTKHTIFQENSYGILEPMNGKIVKPEEIDVVIVPLLAVDEKGNRLGYGKGFYDRFLVNCKPNSIFIGLTMFDILEDLGEMDKHDIPIHFVVTPQGVLRTEAQL